MDGEFDCIKGDLLGIGVTLNTTTNDEHSPVIERYIRTIKEGVRSVYTVLPFKRIPTIMLTDLVYNIIFWKNAFLHKENIDNRLSPRAIVSGMPIDFKTACQLEYGSYVQTHEDHNNSLQERTSGAIALRPMGNAQGGWFFMSLQTGRRLCRFQWTPLPMPQDVITRVEKMARRNHAQRDIAFYYRDGTTPINNIANDDYTEPAGVNNIDDDGTDDESYQPEDDSTSSSSETDNTSTSSSDDINNDGETDSYYERIATQYLNTNNNTPTDVDNNANDDPIPDTVISDDNYDEFAGVIPDEVLSAETTGVTTPDPSSTMIEADVSNDHISQADFDKKMDELYGSRTRDGMRDRKPRDYSHLFLHKAEYITPRSFSHIRDIYGIDDPIMEALVATQYTVDKGIKKWGERSVEAVDVELRQLHDREVGEPKMRHELSPEIRRLALRYLMFFKEKRSGQIKGRGCADGRPQRVYTKKEDKTSPTCHIESLIITCIIDSMEGRDVATVDIPGAFMQANIDDETYVKIQGAMCDIFVQIDPDRYAKFVCVEHGRNTIYLKLKKALYGTLKAAKLFYEDLVGTLKGWGF